MSKSVPTSFFARPADVVARELLGMQLCVKMGNSTERLFLTETEAYLGPHDLACHSSKGITPRTEVMFGAPGTIYVYLVYGMYHMLNIVTGNGAAVLIRGAGKYDGPGKLTKALNITKAHNAKPLSKGSGIWIEAASNHQPTPHAVTPRIGVAYAKEWAGAPLRFVTV